jgi:hypothetical protein
MSRTIIDLRGAPVFPAVCPSCGKIHDGASKVEDEIPASPARPKPGDLSICARCGALSQYTRDLDLVSFDESELDDRTRATIAEARRAISLVWGSRKPLPRNAMSKPRKSGASNQ